MMAQLVDDEAGERARARDGGVSGPQGSEHRAELNDGTWYSCSVAGWETSKKENKRSTQDETAMRATQSLYTKYG